MLVERALLKTGRPLRAVCIREVQQSLSQSVKRLVEDKIIGFGLQSRFELQREHIGTGEGGLIIFQGMQNHTAASIKSLEGYDIAWVEEAQSLSQRSLDLLYPTIREPGSEIWFTWNPTDPKDPVDKFFFGNENDPDFFVKKLYYTDNPWFPEELRRDMERDKRRDPEKYAHVWLGEYQRLSEARVFRNWRIGEPNEFDASQADRFYFGADWGFSVDPSVLVRCYIVGRTLYVDREACQVGCEIDYLPALFDKIEGGQARKWPITADGSRSDVVSYMRRHGYEKIKPARKGPGSLEDGVEFLKNFDIVVHPACTNAIDELTRYAYKVDPKTTEVLPVLEDKHNHVIDALRYAVEALRRSQPVDIGMPVRVTAAPTTEML